tara:strand:- start:681 stop:1211 length:531 start_codon:yes stop_codon:yes gene_type:complete
MNKINKSKKFISVNIVLITISDSRKEDDDKSGKILEDRILNFGHKIFKKIIVKDDVSLIKKTILNYAKEALVDVIITTGGTGLTGRDSTPEALMSISDKFIEGFGELFRYLSFKKIGTSTIQSRALAAVVKGTYVFSLPGSPSACKDGWDGILKYQLDIRHQPCNFIEIMPRLNEK